MVGIKKRIALALAVFVGLVGAVSVEQTAYAYGAYGCSTGYVCVYTDAFGGGSKLSIPSSYGPGCVNLNGGWNDVVSTVSNGTGWRVQTFSDAGCSGFGVSLSADCSGCPASYANFTTWPLNDSASSVRLYTL